MKTKYLINTKLILFFGLFFISITGLEASENNTPSDVFIDSMNILNVQKPGEGVKPFQIKGVNWSPATKAPKEGVNPKNKDEKVDYGFFFDWDGRNPQGHDILNYWLKQELTAHYKKDVKLMKKMNVNTVRIYQPLDKDVKHLTRILDEFEKNKIMVIVTVAISKSELNNNEHKTVVRACMKHPAVLMWAIGNEWNFNKLYDYCSSIEDTAKLVNSAADDIKKLEIEEFGIQKHPVCTILGDDFTNFADSLNLCGNIDIWGLNIYRGESFGDLFNEWTNKWQEVNQAVKPFFISEFGIDSFKTAKGGYSVITPPPVGCFVNPAQAKVKKGKTDESTQARIDLALWNEITENLSISHKGDCLGGAIFEFNDELWKVGSYHVGLGGLVNYTNKDGVVNDSYRKYNKYGFALDGASPDNVLNEEYFGLVDANRKTKKVYKTMQEAFKEVQ